jgi:hypothetical protein
VFGHKERGSYRDENNGGTNVVQGQTKPPAHRHSACEYMFQQTREGEEDRWLFLVMLAGVGALGGSSNRLS